ncbi:MAG: efflux RND transporter permease subunit, partial [Terriglobia bacterium]
GTPSVMLAVYQLLDANALDVSKEVRSEMKNLAGLFPTGIRYSIPLDTTNFVTASIHEVMVTLLITFLLVFVVVYVFLQNLRATLIPLLTVPISLVGACAAFTILGFSINTLTLFGLVLAIGLVVDDAIVVVEACQSHIDEEGMSAKEAAKKAMSEVSGPVVAVALVLTAVFVPVAFMGGITGQLYKQFALTLAVSVLISALEALTLSPALCALLLSPAQTPRGPVGLFFRGFNRVFMHTTRGYESSVKFLVRRKAIIIAGLVIVIIALYGLLKILPSGFVPPEDQGYFLTSIQLPNAASLDRTSAVVTRMENILKSMPGVQDVVSIGAFNLVGGTYNSNAATIFVILKPWDERGTPQLSLNAILASFQRQAAGIPQAVIMSFNPPAIPGLGTTGGFQFELQDRSGGSVQALAETAGKLIGAASKQPAIQFPFTTFRADVPQIALN